MSMALPVKPDCMGSHYWRGYTLLELMIVCALMAIMLTFAIPSYQSYVQRAHRGTAIEVLLGAAACQERIYARDFSYDTNRCLPRAEKDDKYAFGFEPENVATASLFSVNAEPLGAQAGDPCGSLMLDQSGARSITGPVERLRKCWEGR
jgi:type IV pilus assembly protein PilE